MTASKAARAPAAMARADVASALSKIDRDNLQGALTQLSHARIKIRRNARLSSIDALVEHVSVAHSALLDTLRGHGSYVVKAKTNATLALAYLEAEVAQHRTNNVIVGNTEYRITVLACDPETGVLHCDLYPTGDRKQ